jgi:hypothetical protein
MCAHGEGGIEWPGVEQSVHCNPQAIGWHRYTGQIDQSNETFQRTRTSLSMMLVMWRGLLSVHDDVMMAGGPNDQNHQSSNVSKPLFVQYRFLFNTRWSSARDFALVLETMAVGVFLRKN